MFKKGIIIGIGMSAGTLIQLIATPWLARQYSPQEFGNLAIFMAVMAVLSNSSCLRHDAAILVVQDSRVNPTVWLAFIYVIFFSFFGGISISMIAPNLLGVGYSVFKENTYLLVLGAIGSGTVLLACALSMRREEYVVNALIRATQGLAYVVFTLYIATGLIEGWSYAWGIIGILSAIYLILNTQTSSFATIIKQAINLKEYSLILTPTFLLDSIALALPIFFLNYSYTASEVGNYSQINKLIGGPLLLVSAVIGQILIEKTGKYYRNNQSSYNIFKNSIFILIAISSFAIVTIILFGSYLVDLVLGNGWRSDTLFLLLVLIPIICKIIVSPVTCVFLTHQKTKYVSTWQILYIIIIFVVLFVATKLNIKLELFLGIYALTEVLMYSLYYYWAQKVVKNYK